MANFKGQIKTKEDFDSLTKNNPKVAVDFTATWCGPCKKIGPIFEKLAAQYEDIIFCKVDVDENQDTSEAEEISSMPTFKFFNGGVCSNDLTFSGSSDDKLKQALDSLDMM